MQAPPRIHAAFGAEALPRYVVAAGLQHTC